MALIVASLSCGKINVMLSLIESPNGTTSSSSQDNLKDVLYALANTLNIAKKRFCLFTWI